MVDSIDSQPSSFRAWFLSARDWKYKLAFIVGLALIGYGEMTSRAVDAESSARLARGEEKARAVQQAADEHARDAEAKAKAASERAAARTQLYGQVLDHRRKQEDAAVIDSGAAFLDLVRSDATPDPRTAQVEGYLQASVVREALRLTREGQTDQAGALLARFAATSAGPSTQPTDRSI